MSAGKIEIAPRILTTLPATGISAAVSAGVAVGAPGVNSLPECFWELTPRDGLPVLRSRPRVDESIAEAMDRELIERSAADATARCQPPVAVADTGQRRIAVTQQAVLVMPTLPPESQ